MTKSRVSFVFPTYNERDNILKVIPMVKTATIKAGFDYEIIVVDDNSPDKTADAINSKFKGDKKIRVIKRIENRGYATAIRTGIEASSGDLIGSFDADYLGPARPLEGMLAAIKDKRVDLLVASRYINAAGGMELRFRNIASHIFSLILNILGYPLTDNTSGFYLIRRNALFKLDFDQIFFGYGDCFFRMGYLVKKNNLLIKEVPVFYPKRIYGESKTKLATVTFKYLYEAVKFRLQQFSF